MKKTLILTVFIVTSLSVITEAQEIIDLIAAETCECLDGKVLEGKTEDELNMELGFCIIESLTRHEDDIEVNIMDQQAMQAIGEKIGMRMATKCPTILQKVAASHAKTTTEVKMQHQVRGVFKRLEGDEFNFIIIEDESGREHKYLWLRYFSGSEKLMKDPAALSGKRIRLTYETIECYSPRANEYYDYKEVKALEVL